MKVVCKNVGKIIQDSKSSLLTIDKIYDVLSTDLAASLYLIEDDSDNKRWYSTSRFEDMAIIRQDKLKQLGII
jgi:hypothetical protein